jgi:hypothetical protein
MAHGEKPVFAERSREAEPEPKIRGRSRKPEAEAENPRQKPKARLPCSKSKFLYAKFTIACQEYPDWSFSLPLPKAIGWTGNLFPHEKFTIQDTTLWQKV